MGWYFLIVNRKPVPEVRLLERSRLTTPTAEQRRPPEQCGRSALSGAAGASRTARHGPALGAAPFAWDEDLSLRLI